MARDTFTGRSDGSRIIAVRLAWMVARLHDGGFTRADFFERFPVALRTFRRDLDTLRLADVAIAFRDGTYRFSTSSSGARDHG